MTMDTYIGEGFYSKPISARHLPKNLTNKLRGTYPGGAPGGWDDPTMLTFP